MRLGIAYAVGLSATLSSPMPPKAVRITQWTLSDLAIPQATRTPAQKLSANPFRTYASEAPPKPERILRDSRKPLRLKPWQRILVIGTCLGSIYFTTYRYYTEKKLKDAFVVYKLVAKEPVSSTASIFYLEPREKSQDFQAYREAWRKGI